MLKWCERRRGGQLRWNCWLWSMIAGCGRAAIHSVEGSRWDYGLVWLGSSRTMYTWLIWKCFRGPWWRGRGIAISAIHETNSMINFCNLPLSLCGRKDNRCDKGSGGWWKSPANLVDASVREYFQHYSWPFKILHLGCWCILLQKRERTVD